LVATAALAKVDLSRLQTAWLAVSTSPELAPVLERLQLRGLALPDPESYAVLADMARSITTPFENI
ncbi:MAG: phosphate ABC transporter substrate-binding protein, partial [Polaromonas sp.]|nr:phosphate ABC transporter substrate-binding protein [Polaromonas sp.]